jgi:hypothetical protein
MVSCSNHSNYAESSTYEVGICICPTAILFA